MNGRCFPSVGAHVSWVPCRYSNNNLPAVPFSVPDCVCLLMRYSVEDEPATKMARSGVDSTSEGPGTLVHGESAIDRESIGSSTAPNSPPA